MKCWTKIEDYRDTMYTIALSQKVEFFDENKTR
ncbi:hypothetical protein DFR58_1366 [Anaerobacterium chartisolvens]|uniref:Uncharacterized protein n=1 Tax=Anaerobacterium chartisolvens TaxID=1297424 RepID=A0A369AIZ4_9FIRM|nr:hypothetical protein DFR58_1366 [Anaerobacterium chartisolvens]